MDESNMYLTLADGTDISFLPFDQRHAINRLGRKDLLQIYEAYTMAAEIYDANKPYCIMGAEYLLPDDEDYIFGYVLQVREREWKWYTYLYLDFCIGNGQIKTVRCNLGSKICPISRAIKKRFGSHFELEDLTFRLIQLSYSNILNNNGEVCFTKINYAQFYSEIAEENLVEAVKGIFEL